jgi:putative DNA primase/helicase
MIRYCHAWGAWLVYRDGRWAVDVTDQIGRFAKETVESIFGEAEAARDDEERRAIRKWALESESRKRLEAMVILARSEDGIPIEPDQLDRDPWLLNVANGTIDLRTGDLRPHRRCDFLSKMAPVEFDPNAACLLWERTVATIMNDDPELIGYVRRSLGYALAGDPKEQVLFFLHGGGANGKSTMLNQVGDILGDYACTVQADLLMAKESEAHPTGLTDLEGRRFVTSIEVEDGRRIAESLVKSMTGGDKIRARRLYRDHYEFTPRFKLFVAANHKPVIRGTDHAIWRRIRLIPFGVTIPDDRQDRDLARKLRTEWSGILNWLVRGCLEWQRLGLRPPAAVADATSAYRAEMDNVGRFIEEACETSPGASCMAGNLYDAYARWCENNGVAPSNSKAFGNDLDERGFRCRRRSEGNCRIGIRPRAGDMMQGADDPTPSV